MEMTLKKEDKPELDKLLSLIKGVDPKAQLRLMRDLGYAEGIEDGKKLNRKESA